MNKYLLIIITFTLLAISCAEDSSLKHDDYSVPYLSIYAPIEGGSGTRAVINETGTADEWSYVDFEVGDEMGFFSSGGNYTAGNYGEAPFENQKLIYTGGTGGANFRDPNDTQFSPSHMNGNEIFIYFPYSEDITSPTGMVLRTKTSPTGEKVDTARCIDFLSARHLEILGETTASSAALYGEFQHTFAELIIMRGEGFDNPPRIEGINTWQIKAVLNTPVTGIRAEVSEDEESWSCEPKLVWDSKAVPDRNTASTWEAWLGANYYKTQQDTVGQNAWYVIVPTIGSEAKYTAPRPGFRTTVEYIELYDNDGNLQRVSSLLLSNGNSKKVDGGWRYPMEITMKELVPTANPCQIVPWKDDIDLTDERKRGINDERDFINWASAYNDYIKDPTDENKSNALLQYGDLYVSADGEEKNWQFYILADLDLSSYSPEGPWVQKLEDLLDGQSTVFTNGRFGNYKISGLTSTLIGSLEGKNAQVQNIDFISPNLRFFNDSYDTPTGIITNNMTGGSLVKNCRIDNGTLYCPEAPGGMVAGEVEEGTIMGCTLKGMLISKKTFDKIIGSCTDPKLYTHENNDVTIVVPPSEEGRD